MSLNRKTQPPLNISGNIPLPEVERFSMANGIEGYLIEGGTQDVVRLEVLFDSGSSHQEKAIQAATTANTLRFGARGKTSHQISETFDFYGAYFSTEPEKDVTGVSLFCLSKDFHLLLPLVSELIKAPEFPKDEVNVYLANRRQEFLVNEQKVQTLARRHFLPLIFGAGHPYGKIENEKDFLHLKVDDLKAFHQCHYHPGNCKVLIAGRPPVKWKEMLDENLGSDWAINKTAKTDIVFPETKPGKSFEKIQKDGALQAAMRIGKQSINKSHPDFPALSIANTLLGGFFGSRLMQNIRQDKGYTYGIGSLLVSFRHTGMFFISTQVGTEVCKPALDEIIKETERMGSELAGGEEIDILRNYLLGAMVRSMDGPFAQSDKLRDLLGQGLDFSFTRRAIEEINSISAQRICEVSQKYLNPGSMSILMAGDVGDISA